jgi:hypothetical protein
MKFIILAICFMSFSALAETVDCSSLEGKLEMIQRNQSYNIEALKVLASEVQKNPECDDGYYAEGIMDIVSKVAKTETDEGPLVRLIARHSGEVSQK